MALCARETAAEGAQKEALVDIALLALKCIIKYR